MNQSRFEAVEYCLNLGFAGLEPRINQDSVTTKIWVIRSKIQSRSSEDSARWLRFSQDSMIILLRFSSINQDSLSRTITESWFCSWTFLLLTESLFKCRGSRAPRRSLQMSKYQNTLLKFDSTYQKCLLTQRKNVGTLISPLYFGDPHLLAESLKTGGCYSISFRVGFCLQTS